MIKVFCCGYIYVAHHRGNKFLVRLIIQQDRRIGLAHVMWTLSANFKLVTAFLYMGMDVEEKIVELENK